MDALEWDDEELITRDKRWPGPSFERAARQARRVRVVGSDEHDEDAIETNVVNDRRYRRADIEAVDPEDELPTLRGNPIENIDWMLDPEKVAMLDVESVIDAELIFDAELIMDAQEIAPPPLPPDTIEIVAEPVVEESGEIIAGSSRALVHVPVRERASGRIDFDAFLEESFPQPAPAPANDAQRSSEEISRTSTPPDSWFSDAMDMLDEAESESRPKYESDYSSLMPSELGARPRPVGPRRRNHGWFGVAAIAGLLALGAAGLWQYRQQATSAPNAATTAADAPSDAQPAAATRQGLALTSAQSGVSVEVDGVKRGTLPLLLDDLSAGKHQLRFSNGDKYRSIVETVEVVAGEIQELERVELQPAMLSLRIDLEPSGAAVVVRKLGTQSRKKLQGPWPRTVELEPGDYEVTAFRYGYVPTAQNIRFDGKAERSVELKLQVAPSNPDDIYESL